MTIDEIRDNFALLDDWDDRYRYVIELGRTLDPMPEAEHSQANKVQGCASQVWLSRHVERGSAGEPLLKYLGDSDAHIVRGLIAILLTLYSGLTPQEILAHRCDCAVRRIRVSRTPDAAAFQRSARHGRADPDRRPRGACRRLLSLELGPTVPRSRRRDRQPFKGVKTLRQPDDVRSSVFKAFIALSADKTRVGG